MDLSAINQCQVYLEDQYSSLFENFKTFENVPDIEKIPTWHTVDTLLKPSELNDSHAVFIRDPEIGICLYLIPFIPNKTDINSQLASALQIRSRLLPEYSSYDNDNKVEDADSFGSWRVILHWLVDQNDYPQWLEEIVNIRSNTAHFEEISVDAVWNEKGDWETSIKEHGFPRLLLTCRSIFKKTSPEQITRWSSADDYVRRELEGFQNRFSDLRTQEFAGILEEKIRSFEPKTPTNYDDNSSLSNINKIKIQNFRNILHLELKLGDAPVKSTIVHGPNGTGKSAICESLSLGLCGTSDRYNEFLKDPDTKKNSIEYLKSYLTPMKTSDESSKWNVSINDEKSEATLIENSEDSSTALRSIKCNILSQESSQEFLKMNAEELGGYILQGYSDLAEHIESALAKNIDETNSARVNFLNSYGLKTNISRIDTAKERVADTLISRELPSISHQLENWVNSTGDGFLKANMQSIKNKESLRNNIIKKSELEGVEADIHVWIKTYNTFCQATTEKAADIKSVADKVDFLKEKTQIWNNWLTSKKESAASEKSDQVSSLKTELKILEEKRQKITEKGKEYKARVAHLEQAKSFVENYWQNIHPETCPTCDTDLKAREGILKVITQIEAETSTLREAARNDYQEFTNKIVEVQKRLSDIGISENPINQEDRDTVIELLQPLITGDQPFEDYIRNPASYQALIQQLDILRQIPDIPAAVHTPDELARNVSEKFKTEFSKLLYAMDAPQRWNEIGKELNTVLSSVVGNHLPETIGKLWKEIIFNLTPGMWLLPSEPDFSVKAHRGSKKVSVVLEDSRLAKYILNRAEIHILGLAWFFTSYLTTGRFKHSLICMDDPAQEMDQATYRDLCRLWETLIRLHKFNDRPLTFIALLNQEDRSLDAARATNGTLNVLNWSGKYQENDERAVEKIIVLGNNSYSCKPETKLAN